jgi:hypothetical protein
MRLLRWAFGFAMKTSLVLRFVTHMFIFVSSCLMLSTTRLWTLVVGCLLSVKCFPAIPRHVLVHFPLISFALVVGNLLAELPGFVINIFPPLGDELAQGFECYDAVILVLASLDFIHPDNIPIVREYKITILLGPRREVRIYLSVAWAGSSGCSFLMLLHLVVPFKNVEDIVQCQLCGKQEALFLDEIKQMQKVPTFTYRAFWLGWCTP